MFCKAITKSGTPCIRQAMKCGKYCGSHKGKYKECPICYDDMQARRTLKCGHSFCVTCLCKCGDACPMCRQETNDIPYLIEETVKTIGVKLGRNDWLSRDERKKNVKECCDMFMSVHYKFLTVEKFMSIFVERVKDLSIQGVDMDKIVMQLESFNSRVAC